LMPFFALVRSKLEYASFAWNSVAITDSCKLEWIQRKFATLCHSRFLQDVEYDYDNLLEKLKLLTLHNRHHHFNALFLINVFSGTKRCPCILKTVSMCLPAWNIHNFTMFACSSTHCPSARCVSAANAVCKHADIFSNLCLNVK
jgi:hypothetical protein